MCKDILKKCRNCIYFEENGIGYSTIPECMYYREYAETAVDGCTAKRKANS